MWAHQRVKIFSFLNEIWQKKKTYLISFVSIAVLADMVIVFGQKQRVAVAVIAGTDFLTFVAWWQKFGRWRTAAVREISPKESIRLTRVSRNNYC